MVVDIVEGATERKLPNGVFHSISEYELSNESTVYAEFDRGVPLYWSQSWMGDTIIMGKHGCKYVIYSNDIKSILTRQDCYVDANFEWGSIHASTNGTVRAFEMSNGDYRPRNTILPVQATKLTGFMQDGHICAEQVTAWMDPKVNAMLEFIGKSTCQSLILPYEIINQDDFEDVYLGALTQFDSIYTKK